MTEPAPSSSMSPTSAPTPERVWTALTDQSFISALLVRQSIESEWRAGSRRGGW